MSDKLLEKYPWFTEGNSKACVVADSTNPKGNSRLISLVLKYPVIIDQEVLTHRMFARNSESKRAISFKKIKDRLGTDYFIKPIFGKEKRDMQDDGPLDEETQAKVQELYNDYLNTTLRFCEQLNELDVHHQMVNRYISPFITTCRIMTGTYEQWAYFINLRDHVDAEPHIQELAKAIQNAISNSVSQHSMVHLPFNDTYITCDIRGGLESLVRKIAEQKNVKGYKELFYDSVARAARISYLNYENTYTYEKNKEFVEDRLWANKHCSPFEHVALSRQFYNEWDNLPSVYGSSWFSYRTLLEISS